MTVVPTQDSGRRTQELELRTQNSGLSALLLPSAHLSNVYTFKDFEGSSHRILIDLIRRFSPRGGRLLDLGAAGGELGAAVRDHFDRTIGFEYDADRIGDLHG